MATNNDNDLTTNMDNVHVSDKSKEVDTDKYCQQSPINIAKDCVIHDKTLHDKSVEFDYKLGDIVTVETLPHGFICRVKQNATSTLKSSHLPGIYVLEQFHEHHGNDADEGSEHTIEGEKLSGEIHLVFYNTKYGSFANAVKEADGLAVLGILLKESSKSDNNAIFNPLIESLKKAIEEKQKVAMPSDFDLSTLLPENQNFFTYCGSLTTAPFAECVLWTVFKQSVNISTEQMNVFRQIIKTNYREVQNLNDRPVRASFAYHDDQSHLHQHKNEKKHE
jgi:carbonic anhydrase